MSGLVALEGMAQVVLVVHVALGAEVIIEAHLALPAHTHDAMLLAAVTDDVGVTHPWGRRRTRRRRRVQMDMKTPVTRLTPGNFQYSYNTHCACA